MPSDVNGVSGALGLWLAGTYFARATRTLAGAPRTLFLNAEEGW